MLEGIVASILNRVLGSYVKNFDPKQLNIGIWNGDVKLRDLALKREALDRFHLPIDVIEGHLGELIMQIPWSNLKNKPVKIEIKDVFILAEPKIDEEYNADEEERRAQAVKFDKLDQLELMERQGIQTSSGMSQEEIRRDQSFTESLTTKIIENLQITIRNIHVRYEDRVSVAGHPFSLGFTLAELSALSTDQEWNPVFIQEPSAVTRKLVRLESMAIYWNTDSASILEDTSKDEHGEELLFSKFKDMIGSQATAESQYILKPVSGLGRITMNKVPTEKAPQTRAQLIFDELGFVFDTDQYRDALLTAESFRLYMRTMAFKKFRPAKPVEQDPRAWFIYAAKVVLNEIQEKRKEWTWDHIELRTEQRRKYVELYKIKLLSHSATPEQQKEIRSLEWDLDFDSIVLFRSLARIELKKQSKLKSVAEASKQRVSTWSSWIWGEPTQEHEEEPVQMTDEQRKELYDAIEWDEKQSPMALELARDQVKLEVETSLRSGSFSIRKGISTRNRDVASVLFNGFKAQFFQRPDSFLVNLSLDEFRVDDLSQGTLYEQVVTVKPLTHADEHVDHHDGVDNDVEVVVNQESSGSQDVFFWLSFENNPLDGNADSNLFIKMKSMTLFYNKSFVKNVALFFKPPSLQLETISALMNAAGDAVEGLRQQTRLGLEYALQEHKTANVKLDMQAPLVVVPLDPTSWSCPCAILDVGHISLVSKLVDKEVLDQVNSRQTQKYSEKEWKQLEMLMYDKFDLRLHDAQILLGQNIRQVMGHLHNSDGDKYHVLGHVNIDFVLQVSILPSATSLTKFKVSGKLPTFKASMSDAKYKLLMKIIDQCIPNFDEWESPTTIREPEHEDTATNGADQLLSRRRNTISGSSVFPELDVNGSEQSMIHHKETANTALAAYVSTGTRATSASQKTFQFDFTIDELIVSLYRCTNTSTFDQERFVDMRLSGFELQYVLEDREMMANVRLGSLLIEEFIDANAPPSLRTIASSEGQNARKSDPATTEELFYVKYNRVKRPTIVDGEEIADQNIRISMSTIRFVVAPKVFLTVLDFIITTFTDPQSSGNVKPNNDNPRSESHSEIEPAASQGSGEIDVSVDLSSIIIMLNDDSIKIATITLDTAFVMVNLVSNSMKVRTRIGSLSVHDDVNEGSSRDSMLRELVSIEGSDLADFRYETVDPNSKDCNYASSVYFHTGSMTVNVVEEPLTRIMRFFTRFNQMKGIYDQARQLAMNQATNMEDADKIKLDILIKTPILVFPRPVIGDTMSESKIKFDTMTVNLGEIYIKNEFVPVDKTTAVANNISAEVRDVKISSRIHENSNSTQDLEIIDNLNLKFGASFVAEYENMDRPSLIVTGMMSETVMNLTEQQFKYFMYLSRSVPAIFESQGLEGDEVGAIQDELKQTKQLESFSSADVTVPSNVDKLDFNFSLTSLSLTLYKGSVGHTATTIGECSLSQFSLNDTQLKCHINKIGDMDGGMHIHSFTIHDTRAVKDNKHTEIIPSAKHEEHQFMCSITKRGNHVDSLLSVDSPQMILALDYLVALKEFVDFGVSSDSAKLENNDNEDTEEDSLSISSGDVSGIENGDTEAKSSGLSISYHLNVIDASLILLADPKNQNSEAIVFKIEQAVISQRDTTTVGISKIGIFICEMKSFNTNRLRILNDFSVTGVIDSRNSDDTHLLSSITIDIEELVLRLSLRDVLLVMNILRKASALMSSPDSAKPSPKYSKFSSSERRKLPSAVRTLASGGSKMVRRQRRASKTDSDGGDTVVRGEELKASLDGVRLVIIGVTYELPILDLCVKPFVTTAKNWTGDLRVDMANELFVNVYNPSKSSWEPLVEDWEVGLNVSRAADGLNTSLTVYSRKVMEVTITPQTIRLVNSTADFVAENQDDDNFLSRPREVVTPYLVRNETGYEIQVWADDSEGSSDERKNLTSIKDGEEIPWQFVDWEIMRENLSTDQQDLCLGVHLMESPYSDVRAISVTSVGEHLHVLYPKLQMVSDRIVCDIRLRDQRKVITIRSPLVIKNSTQVAVQLALLGDESGKTWTLEPNSSRAIPLWQTLDAQLVARPDPSLGFTWSKEDLYWQDLLKGTRALSCPPIASDSDSTFYFQAFADYDKNIPLTRIYPYMTVNLSAPLEIVNLLPFDFTYRLYSKEAKKDWTNELKKGESSPVHVVQLRQLLLLSVHPKQAGYDRTDFSVVNTKSGDDFKLEDTLTTHHRDGQKLKLKIHYMKKADGSGYHIVVYSPYVILNKTGLDLRVSTKFNSATSRVSAVEDSVAPNGIDRRALPKMWSFENDDHNNRVSLKVGDSRWSDSVSFEVIGSSYEVVTPSNNRQQVFHLGINVAEGEGKYKLTKVVTISPRFIVYNKLSEDVEYMETDGAESSLVQANRLKPIQFLRQSHETQIVARFTGPGSKWSAPFVISNVGRSYVKLFKKDEGTILIKIDVLLQDATLFVHLQETNKNNWPYSIRNFTNLEFIFYQANPNVDDQGVDQGPVPFKPIKYRIPRKSAMPYAWDFPAAAAKEVILECNGKKRSVQLAELGELPPMKVLPNSSTNFPGAVVDLNVIADGPQQTLILTDYDPEKSIYKLKNASESHSSVMASSTQVDQFAMSEEIDGSWNTSVRLQLKGIGISMISGRNMELCYATLRGIELGYSVSDLYDNYTMKIKWIQIDNQLYGGLFPVIFYPSVVPKSNKEMDNHPTLSGSVTIVRDDSYGVLFVKHATVLLQQVTLELDEDFVFALMGYFDDPDDEWPTGNLSLGDNSKLCDESLHIIEPERESEGLEVYFEVLHIQPTQMDLSFVRTERINADYRMSNEYSLGFFLNVLTMAIGNINDAPLKLNALLMENVRTPLPRLEESITTFYSQQFLYQVHKVVGSADVLGNPVGLFNNISSGFMDMFYEPYLGYTMNDRPQELGIGIAKGGISFIKKSIFGVSDSIFKVTGSISKGLSVATMDREFQNRRRLQMGRNRPKHAIYGVTSGVTSFADSLASGISGLALNPMEGAARGGTSGFFKGLGKGMIGLPTKAAIGLFDFASNVSEGVRNTTTVFDGDSIARVRPTRFIGRDGIVRPYVQRESMGQTWLKSCNGGQYFSDDYVAHLSLTPSDAVVIVTYNRIVMLSTSQMRTEWEVRFSDLQTVAMERNGIGLILRGGVQGPFVPIPDVDSRRYLYKNIGTAVKAYNKKRQTFD